MKANNKYLKNTKGFTLVEILVVAVIIGILATAAVIKGPTIIRQQKAKAAARALYSYEALVQDFKNKYNRLPITEAAGATQTGTVATGISHDNVTFADCLHGASLIEEVPDFKFGDNPIESANFTTSGVTWAPATRTFAGTPGITWSTSKYNRIEIYSVNPAAATPITAATGEFNGNFTMGGAMIATARPIAVAVYENISYDEARALAAAVNKEGEGIWTGTYGDPQQNGKVVFGSADASGNTTAYVYISE